MLSKLLGRDFPSLLKKAQAAAEAGRWGDAKLGYERAAAAKDADEGGLRAAQAGLARAKAELARKNVAEAELDAEAGEAERALDRLRTALSLTADEREAQAIRNRIVEVKRSLRDPAAPPSLDEEEEEEEFAPEGEEPIEGVYAPGEEDDEAYGESVMERYELALLGLPEELAARYLELGEEFAEAYLDTVEERFEDAERDFARLEKTLGGSAVFQLERGKALAGLGETERAEKALRRAGELDPSLEEAVFALARVLLAEGKREEARRRLEEAQAGGLKTVDVALLLAECDLAGGDAAAAERGFEAARGMNDEDPRAHDGLGRAAEARQDWDLAWKHYRRAVRLQPKNPELRFRLANVVARHPKEFVKALDLFKALLREDYGEKWFLYAQIGRIYHRKKWFEQAEEVFEQALALLPEADRDNRAAIDKALAEVRGARG